MSRVVRHRKVGEKVRISSSLFVDREVTFYANSLKNYKDEVGTITTYDRRSCTVYFPSVRYDEFVPTAYLIKEDGSAL